MGQLGLASKRLRGEFDVLNEKEASGIWSNEDRETREAFKKELDVWLKKEEIAWRYHSRAL